MPDKIKEMRNRNDEFSRLIDDSYLNQTSNISVQASNNPFFQNYHSSGSFYAYPNMHQSYLNQQQLNQQAQMQRVAAIENHDFEDFLNMV
jgi:hypothetical protein